MAEQDRDYSPPIVTIQVRAMVNVSREATLFQLLAEVAGHDQFTPMSNDEKARCAQHLADLLRGDDGHAFR